jgi:hypothetical protein
MGGRAQLRRWRQGTWAVLALPTAAIVGLLAAESLLWPLAPDQGIYAWISDVIRDGGLPYADAWDIKGPSTFYTVALAQLVLGRHPWSIRVVDVVLLAITCGGLALLARRYAGPLAAVVSAGLFALWYLGSGFWDTGQPDAWATTLLVAAVVVATSSRLGLHARMAVAGLLLGACIGYKPLFALFLLVLVAAWATEERRPWTALLAGVASAAVVPLVIALWFWIGGGLDDLLEVQLVFNRTSYRTNVPLPDQLTAIRGYLVTQVGIALLLAVLGAIALLGRSRQLGVVVLTWGATAMAVVCIQGRYFTYHWTPVSALLALTAGVGCAQLVAAVAPRLGSDGGWAAPAWLPGTAIAGALLVAAAWGPMDGAVRRVVNGRRPDRAYRDAFVRDNFSAARQKRISSWLRQHTDPDDAVLLWGYDPGVYFLSHRSSADRFGYTLPVVGEQDNSELVEEYRDELLADVRRRPPPYVVVLENDGNPILPETSRQYLEQFPELESLMSSRYEELTRIGDEATVLRLRST